MNTLPPKHPHFCPNVIVFTIGHLSLTWGVEQNSVDRGAAQNSVDGGVAYSTSSQNDECHQIGRVVPGVEGQEFLSDINAKLSWMDLKCVLVSCEGEEDRKRIG